MSTETTKETLRAVIEREVESSDGFLRLDPAYVARDWIPAGRRIVVPNDEYDAGERGTIGERWLASTTRADNRVGPSDEGLSYIRLSDGSTVLLRDVVDAAFDVLAGEDYASTHTGLQRLAKIFDYDARVPFHIHPPIEEAVKVGCNSKDEAYYIPPQDYMGPHPETFLGLHRSFEGGHGSDELVDHLKAWNSDSILSLSQAFLQLEEHGFFVPSGVLHAPGTAMTVELQEDSDTLAMLQAVNSGQEISKELLFKDIGASDREQLGEAAILSWIDWSANADPDIFGSLHFTPVEIVNADGVLESWIFCGTSKFSGKRLLLEPGARYVGTEQGVFNLLVWEGTGTVGGVPVVGGEPGSDELLVTRDRAAQGIEYVNTGDTPLRILKFFGPDVNPNSPGGARG
ncbi:hypothetical protein [Demequina sp. NBRC 110052]|uniref:hypothetical protein n=1 Tax=Demequina sp. NBRC 110052 TaxID=1570341 RepID=UPI0009FCBAEA|nr:hypothetical protein [Demequina sp. NBRC 110052]